MKPNVNVVNLTILLIGLLLIYAAIKDLDPRLVVQNALKGQPTYGAGSGPKIAGKVPAPPKVAGKVPAPTTNPAV